MKEFLTNINAEIVFPFVDNPADFNSKNDTSFPNRFIGQLEANENRLQEIRKKIETKVRDTFKNWAEEKVLDKYKDLLTTYDTTQFFEQINNHLEIYWVFNKIENNDYATAFDRLEKMMGGVKNFRQFNQQSEQGRKCSLDGVNNALFYRKNKNNNTPAHLTKAIEIAVKIKFFKAERAKKALRMGEALSAVSMLKRHFVDNESRGFPSTAYIALLHSLEAVKSDFGANINEISTIDDQLFYEENSTLEQIAQAIEDSGVDNYGNNKMTADDLKKNRDAIVDAVKKKGLALDKYYALIHFDGDKMGEWLSGKEGSNDSSPTKLKDASKLKEFHGILSKNLRTFAKWATGYLNGDSTSSAQIVENYSIKKGKTIYAGGDDFLGFINLHYLFEVLASLRYGFNILVNTLELKELLDKDDSLTFSAGIAIAHYKEPLSIVLDNARKAEKLAKDEKKGNRNSFAFIACKGSGEMHQSYFKWAYNEIEPITIFKEFWQHLQADKFNSKFFRILSDELRLLMDEDGNIDNTGALKKEFIRLLNRSKAGDNFTSKKVNAFGEKIFSVYEKSELAISNFLEQLYIIDFIARQTTISNTQLTSADNG